MEASARDIQDQIERNLDEIERRVDHAIVTLRAADVLSAAARAMLNGREHSLEELRGAVEAYDKLRGLA